MRLRLLIVGFMVAIVAAGHVAAAQTIEDETPAEGRGIFIAICHTCHSSHPGINLVGPSLWGVVGRKAASLPDFPYSEAMRKSGFVWTPGQLFEYLYDPQRVLPGVKMHYAGLKSATARSALIAYLQTLRDK